MEIKETFRNYKFDIQENRIFGIDFMRFSAISMVLIAHSKPFLPFQNYFDYNYIRILGYYGVELFFVLSGYLIGLKILTLLGRQNSISSILTFWKHRWLRTLPLYFIMLTIIIILNWTEHNEFLKERALYYLFLQNFITPHPEFFPEAWSLSIEEYSYLIIPIAFFISKYFTATNLTWPEKSLIVILTLYSICISIRLTAVDDIQNWDINLRRIVVYRLDAVLTGVIMSWFTLFKNKFIKIYKIHLMTIGVILTLSSMFIYYNFLLFEKMSSNSFILKAFYFNLTLIAFALFIPFATSLNKNYRYSVLQKVITFIAIISYSIYLVHNTVAIPLVKKLRNSLPDNLDQTFSLIFYIIITLLFATLTYYFIEKPFNNLRKNYPR